MEEAVQFECQNKNLYGILHVPENSFPVETVVLIVTGGPQVRIGGHRLYVELSHFLCQHNVASLRFDYEGIGDSEGSFVGYQSAGSSIVSAVTFLDNYFKSNMNIIIWSLCDGATAAALYAAENPRDIEGLILCNPFVWEEDSLARTTLSFYYKKRLFEKQFWSNIIKFKVDYLQSIKSFLKTFFQASVLSRKTKSISQKTMKSLPDLVIDSLIELNKPVSVILSTDDVVAVNFKEAIDKYQGLNKDAGHNITCQVVSGADHTFTDPESKRELYSMTYNAVTAISTYS